MTRDDLYQTLSELVARHSALWQDDIEPAALFADLAVKALDVTPNSFTSLGMTKFN